MVQKCVGDSLDNTLHPVADGLSDDGRGMVIHGLHQVAAADGRLLDEEIKMLYSAGNILGFRKKAIKKFLSSVES